jgi:hypothetical protein
MSDTASITVKPDGSLGISVKAFINALVAEALVTGAMTGVLTNKNGELDVEISIATTKPIPPTPSPKPTSVPVMKPIAAGAKGSAIAPPAPPKGVVEGPKASAKIEPPAAPKGF